MADLTVSIVNYNAGDYLIKTLKSLEELRDEVELKIFVVDNKSIDDSISLAMKRFPRVKYILNDENLGFGKAHNQILKHLTTEYVLILNPDIILNKGLIKHLISYMEKNPSVGAITPKIVFENNSIDMTAHRGFPTPWASLLYFLGNDSLYHLTNKDLNNLHEVDAITGAFLLTRKKVLEKVGVFDEDYFMYAEDIDLCFRIKQAGFKVIYDPTVSVLHYKGISSGLKKHTQGQTTASRETKERSLNYFYSTMKIFYNKHLERNYPFVINWLVYLGINLRWWIAKRRLTV